MMEGWARIAAGVAGGLVLLTVGALAQARRAWRQGTDTHVAELRAAHFGPDGRIVRITADRYRDVSGRGVLTPWIIELGDYARTGGMMVPMSGSVGCELPAGRFEYWAARIVDISYER